LTPTTVTLTAPDAAALEAIVPLGLGALMVMDAIKLFNCQPVVSTVRR
jgi:hypothetical protein